MRAFTLTIHKPDHIRCLKPLAHLLTTKLKAKQFTFTGFDYVEVAVDAYLREWEGLTEYEHTDALAWAIAHGYLAWQKNALAPGNNDHFRRIRKKWAQRIKPIDWDRNFSFDTLQADLHHYSYAICDINRHRKPQTTANGYTPTPGDLYMPLYVKKTHTHAKDVIDLPQDKWRARIELGIQGSELRDTIEPGQGFKFARQAHRFYTRKKATVKIPDPKTGDHWSNAGYSTYNRRRQKALDNLSRKWVFTDLPSEFRP